MSKKISQSQIDLLRKKYFSDNHVKVVRNAMVKTNSNELSMDWEKYRKIDHTFSNVISGEMPATNQKSSGRCWGFAGLNLFRVYLGRKNTLIWIGILFFVSAIGSAIAWDPYSFSFFRFIGGIGVGASTVASPTYITEISNKESRGKLVALYQFNIVFGILIAYFSNYLFQGFGGDIDWRYMLGVEAIPAIFYILFVLKVPNSPRWLILFKGEDKKAEEILRQIYPDSEIKRRIKQIKDSAENKKDSIFSVIILHQSS